MKSLNIYRGNYINIQELIKKIRHYESVKAWEKKHGKNNPYIGTFRAPRWILGTPKPVLDE